MTERRCSDFPAKPGGIMTDEVGVITGEVTLATEVDDAGGVVHRVQYKDADEWYTVTDDSPKSIRDGTDIDTVHAQAVAELSGPEGPA
jgi:hypothetical protein